MKKTFLLLTIAVSLIAGNAMAHCGKCGIEGDHGKDVQAMMDEKMDKMTSSLELNDDQKMQLKVIMEEKMAEKKKIMEQKYQLMEALHEEFKAKVKGVLSAEQYGKWEAMQEMKEHQCPMCQKDGKMCPMCAKKKGAMSGEGKMKGDDHNH